MQNFSLSKGRKKIERKWQFLKASNSPTDRPEFVIKAIHPRPDGMNITVFFELQEPIAGCNAWPVSKTNYLMLTNSWPHDNSESLIGATVRLRTVTRPGENGKPYSTLHIYELQEPGSKKAIKVAELPSQKATEPEDEMALSQDEVPF